MFVVLFLVVGTLPAQENLRSLTTGDLTVGLVLGMGLRFRNHWMQGNSGWVSHPAEQERVAKDTR